MIETQITLRKTYRTNKQATPDLITRVLLLAGMNIGSEIYEKLSEEDKKMFDEV